MSLVTRWTYRLVLAAALLAVGAIGGVWLLRHATDLLPQFTESDIKQVVLTTLQQETPAAVLITGRLQITADISQANTKYLFPDYFDESISLGTTRSTVRLPGEAIYGVDLENLSADAITFTPDSVLVITITGLQVESVEPNFDGMMVQTEVGWARLSARSGRTVERQAIAAGGVRLLGHVEYSVRGVEFLVAVRACRQGKARR